MDNPTDRSRGQILPLFAFSLVAMLAMAALLFDGAHELVFRRELQNASDAAALAGANVIQSGTVRGCSAVTTEPPGPPRPEVLAAAQASVQANLPSYDPTKVAVTCPAGYSNFVVKVDLNTTSPTFFGGVIGITHQRVAASGSAINGQITGLTFSVVELNPYHASWSSSTRGCPSVLFSGGPTVTFDGSLQVNSACPQGSGGALGANGNAALLTFNNGSEARLVGGYAPGPLTITPTPKVNQLKWKDPLAGLPGMPLSSLPIQKNAKLTISGGSQVLSPGVYKGGIQLKNTSKAFLLPGIYVMDGGVFDLGAQTSVYSVRNGVTSTTTATWASDCPVATCGVLIFNRGTTTSLSPITVGAGANLLLRPYQPAVDLTGAKVNEYVNLLFWQDASPVPTSTYTQPDVTLNGGGTVDLSGTIYAPSARVYMTGGSGGSGGASIDLTLQFISWDLQIQGNSHFHFFYQSDRFAKPTDYGLIK